MLLDNHTKQSPIIGVAGMGGGINSYIFLSSGGGGDASYVISRSLRFNSSDDTRLDNSMPSAGNRSKFTFSFWTKFTGYDYGIISCGTNSSGFFELKYNGNYNLEIHGENITSTQTTSVFRDFSAWYHIMLVIDKGNSTATDRAIFYVNGTRQTLSTTSQANTGATYWGHQSQPHRIGGRSWGGGNESNLLLADFHHLDNIAATPSDFGETDSSGIWQPKQYAGSYGTIGFNLDFKDNSGTTATTLGKDNSGNSNNWTPNGFSVSAGSGNDSLLDSPSQIADQTDSGAGGTVKGNYAIFNSLYGSGTKSNGNLVTTTSGYVPDISSIAPSSGKWYAEITWVSGSYGRIGVQDISEYVTDFGENIYGWRYESNTGNLHNGGVLSSGTSYGTGTTVGIAMDLDAGKLWVSKDNVWQNSGNPSTGANPSASNLPVGHPIAFACASGSGSSVFSVNFGQRPFAYNAPTNFKSLNSANLSPTGPAAEPNKYFDTRSSLLAGGSNDRWTISDLNFSTDLSVSKSTSNDEYWVWTDSVRGFDKVLKSDETDQEASGTAITNVSATGFSATNNWFSTGRTYATFNWDAGTSNTTVAVSGKNSSAYNTTSTWSNNWTASGNGFGSQPPSYGFDANFDNNINNNAGGQYITWNTTSYTLSGLLEINCYSSSGVYNIYVNGAQVAHTPSSRDWISCGSFTDINEIQFGGTSHNSATGLGSAGILIYEIKVAGKTLVDSGVSITTPSLASTVRANPSAGFSIVSYAGNSVNNSTISHGLNGSVPELIITKNLSAAYNWIVYSAELAATKVLALDEAQGAFTPSGGYYGTVGSSTYQLVQGSSNLTNVNNNGNNYVAYCFAPVAGYSAMGSFLGNGSADGPFVFTGFRPAFILVKNSSVVDNWEIYDSTRSIANPTDHALRPDTSGVEFSHISNNRSFDILSNGFKIRGTNAGINGNGNTLVYYAVAEHPFQSSRAR